MSVQVYKLEQIDSAYNMLYNEFEIYKIFILTIKIRYWLWYIVDIKYFTKSNNQVIYIWLLE